jgi:large subunit ribosomal protein L27e
MPWIGNEYGIIIVDFFNPFSYLLLTCRVFDCRMKAGRVVILLAGRRAGKKAVIVKQFDEGKKGKAFPHALVAGVERAPMKVAKKMSKKKIARRSTLKPFVKIVNYNHILPTRFLVTGEFAAKEGSELKTVVTEDKYSNKESRKNLKKEVKAIFTER